MGVRRGREGGYPSSPRTDPGVQFSRTGLFRQPRFRILAPPEFAIPRSEVCLTFRPSMSEVWFPLRASAACQPLPHVNGPTVSEYYGLIRLPGVFSSPTLAFGRLTCRRQRASLLTGPGTTRASQVPVASLHASRALCGPRQTLGALTIAHALCWLLAR